MPGKGEDKAKVEELEVLIDRVKTDARKSYQKDTTKPFFTGSRFWVGTFIFPVIGSFIGLLFKSPERQIYDYKVKLAGVRNALITANKLGEGAQFDYIREDLVKEEAKLQHIIDKKPVDPLILGSAVASALIFPLFLPIAAIYRFFVNKDIEKDAVKAGEEAVKNYKTANVNSKATVTNEKANPKLEEPNPSKAKEVQKNNLNTFKPMESHTSAVEKASISTGITP